MGPDLPAGSSGLQDDVYKVDRWYVIGGSGRLGDEADDLVLLQRILMESSSTVEFPSCFAYRSTVVLRYEVPRILLAQR